MMAATNLKGLARMIHDAAAASADTRLWRGSLAVQPFDLLHVKAFTVPCARLASRLHAFATNLHESCGLG